jgi:secreted trypsin-like serine protease
MAVDKVFRNPLWATVVGALVAAMGVSFLVFVQSGEAAPQAAADEQPPYASVSPRIIGGTAAPNGKYPFMVALLDKRIRGGGAFQQQFCGGTLIDKDSVLTAAHCFYRQGVYDRGIKLQVVVGRTILNQNQGQHRSVPLPHRFIHPRYKALASYDAAVLKLSRPVTGIKPIKLATARQNNLENPGHILRAAGWGVVQQRPGPFDSFPVRMHEVSVPVVSDSRAKRSYQSLGLKYLPSVMVAASTTEKGACQGDSGGPLFDFGSRTQVGITSAGVGCATRIPGIYTEVNNPGIRTWILRAAKR